MPDFDLAVIGAGAAGLSVAAGAAQLGLRVALIERDRMGGECLNTGCVPSKALLAAAHAAMAAREARHLGVIAESVMVDWPLVRAHVRGAIDAIAPMDSEARFTGLGATVIRAAARFAGPDRLAVSSGGVLSARRIVVAAGTRPHVPNLPGLESVPYLTHETLFGLAAQPSHLLILGGGGIGLEMAQAFAGLGSRVTLLEQASLAPGSDPELVEVLRAALTRQGVTILEHVAVASVAPGPSLRLSDGREIAGSHLLIATGRVPNTGALGLEAGGVAAGPRGIATDRGLRSLTNRRVFAAGGIADPAGIGPRHLTHAASHHATVLIRRLVFRLPARIDEAAMPRVLYTDPELAEIGLGEAEARARGLRVAVLHSRFADNDRAVTEQRVEGLVKLVTSRGRIVGAGIVAPHAGEIIAAWGLAITGRVRLSALASVVVPYPTRAEAGKHAVSSAFTARLFSPKTRFIARLVARLP